MTTQPLWHAGATPALPEHDLPRAVDVAVVGAGLTGAAAAALLARAGLAVAVLEARSVAAATTGASTAKVSLLQGTRLSTIARKHPPAVVRQYVEANIQAQAWLEEFCLSHEVPIDRRAAVTFAARARGEQAARDELGHARRAGLAARWVEDLELPFPTRGGVWLDDQWQTDPVQLVHALIQDAIESGASVHEGVRVLQVRDAGPARLETEAGELLAHRVVIATGMPVLDRGGYFARMEARRSYALAFQTALQPWQAMYLSADQPARSLRDATHDGQHLLLVGGEGHPTGRTRSELSHLDRLRTWTRRWWPDAEETHAWSAQDHTTAHQLPFAGPLLPGAEHLLVAGGYAKWGMTNGVAAALALCGEVTGSRVEWGDVYRPWGRQELAGASQVVGANARVGLELASGWLRPVVRPPSDESTGELSRVCTHLGGPLRRNDAERSWDCPLHGSRFDVDGAVLEGPATCALAPR